ncbi:MAG TPA: hypothetical protein VLS93_04220 [Anaeromyxobacteraceae bacterium]|nr:hypothetical protein [Anaeromyxobacteraceae bacterium]
MDRRARARELLLAAIEQVEAELSSPRLALCPKQLCTCRATLQEYLNALERDAMPPRRERDEGLCRLVLDEWPYGLPLGNAILQAERAWRNA